MPIGLSYKVLDSFFDRPKVQRAMDATTRRALSKAGAFVRTRARTSIRPRKGSAQPGKPPHSHDGDLRRGIVFAYDRPNQSVVIGPLAYNIDGGRVPEVLEFGGPLVKVFRQREDGSLSRLRRRGRRVRQVWHYKAFPYMGPALAAEAPNFPDLWAQQFPGGSAA